MKTKFIEGTNKKYSIREDQTVVRNYFEINNKIFNTIKIIKPRKDPIALYVRINGKTMSVRLLLLNAFNIYYCRSCDKKQKTIKKPLRFTCKECRRNQVNKTQSKWAKNNPDKIKAKTLIQSKNLSNSLIVNQYLGYNIKDNIPEHIIKLKRKQILLHRELKNHKKNDTN
jgi:hypothetical protein